MQIIKTLNDIYRLEKQKIITPSLSQLLQNDFKEKAREVVFPEETPDPDFEIDEYGYLVLIQAGDDPNDWAYHGLNLNSKYIFGLNPNSKYTHMQPECVDIIKVNNEDEYYYRIVLLADNDYIMYFYSPVGVHPQNIEETLENMVS